MRLRELPLTAKLRLLRMLLSRWFFFYAEIVRTKRIIKPEREFWNIPQQEQFQDQFSTLLRVGLTPASPDWANRRPFSYRTRNKCGGVCSFWQGSIWEWDIWLTFSFLAESPLLERGAVIAIGVKRMERFLREGGTAKGKSEWHEEITKKKLFSA